MRDHLAESGSRNIIFHTDWPVLYTVSLQKVVMEGGWVPHSSIWAQLRLCDLKTGCMNFIFSSTNYWRIDIFSLSLLFCFLGSLSQERKGAAPWLVNNDANYSHKCYIQSGTSAETRNSLQLSVQRRNFASRSVWIYCNNVGEPWCLAFMVIMSNMIPPKNAYISIAVVNIYHF